MLLHDRVWREALWLVIKKHTIGDNWLMYLILSQFAKVVSCLHPSSTLLFLEQTKTTALEGFIGTIAVGWRETSLCFADDADLIAGSKEKHTDLTMRLTYQHICMAWK